MAKHTYHSAVLQPAWGDQEVTLVRLTPAQAVSYPPEIRYHLHNGAKVGAHGLRKPRLLFDEEDTDEEVRQAHLKRKAEVYAKDKAERKQRRDERNMRNRRNAYENAQKQTERDIVKAAESWYDGPGTAQETTEELQMRLHSAVAALKSLRARGAVPPDCGHALCQGGLVCEEPE